MKTFTWTVTERMTANVNKPAWMEQRKRVGAENNFFMFCLFEFDVWSESKQKHVININQTALMPVSFNSSNAQEYFGAKAFGLSHAKQCWTKAMNYVSMFFNIESYPGSNRFHWIENGIYKINRVQEFKSQKGSNGISKAMNISNAIYRLDLLCI